MKNETLFIAQIYQVVKAKRIPGQIRGIISNPLLEYMLTERLEIEGKFVKETLLRKVSDDKYFDLKDKEIYTNRGRKIGDLFVREETLMPINEILPSEEKGKNITKRKALKRYNLAKYNQ